MKKNKVIIISIVAAIVFAAAGCFAIYQIFTPMRTTVYVFNAPYSAGTQVTADMLTPVQVDSTIVVAGRNTDISDRFITGTEYQDMLQSGDSLRIDVNAGLPLMESMLSILGGNSIEMSMQSTAVAVTVAVDSITGITNELSAGSRVNVYVTYNNSGTSLLLEDMRVLSVQKNSSGEISGATIEVSEDEALQLVEANNRGSIQLGLVHDNGTNASDKEVSEVAQ